jgi:D-arabinose 1-dehydrogenase-like Zn-dependent alcohol dehydrogenase
MNSLIGGWGDAPMPLCVGHEVIGRAIKVGKDVKTVKVGDRVGVGAQIRSCLECGNCKADQENYCPNGKSISCIGECQYDLLTCNSSRRHLRRQVR